MSSKGVTAGLLVKLVAVAGAVLAAGTFFIYFLLPSALVVDSAQDLRATYLIEIGKILATGVVVGILGVWVQKVFERNADAQRQNEKEIAEEGRKAEAARAVVRRLEATDLRSLRECYERLAQATHAAEERLAAAHDALPDSFSDLFRVGDLPHFEALLNQWQPWDKRAAQGVREEFNALTHDYAEQRNDPAFRERARTALSHWAQLFDESVVAVGSLEIVKSHRSALPVTGAEQ